VTIDVATNDDATVSTIDVTYRDRSDKIHGRTFPFDQKRIADRRFRTGRKEKDRGPGKGASPLFGEHEPAVDDLNLGRKEWGELTEWLSRHSVDFYNFNLNNDYHLRILYRLCATSVLD